MKKFIIIAISLFYIKAQAQDSTKIYTTFKSIFEKRFDNFNGEIGKDLKKNPIFLRDDEIRYEVINTIGGSYSNTNEYFEIYSNNNDKNKYKYNAYHYFTKSKKHCIAVISAAMKLLKELEKSTKFRLEQNTNGNQTNYLLYKITVNEFSPSIVLNVLEAVDGTGDKIVKLLIINEETLPAN